MRRGEQEVHIPPNKSGEILKVPFALLKRGITPKSNSHPNVRLKYFVTYENRLYIGKHKIECQRMLITM